MLSNDNSSNFCSKISCYCRFLDSHYLMWVSGSSKLGKWVLNNGLFLQNLQQRITNEIMNVKWYNVQDCTCWNKTEIWIQTMVIMYTKDRHHFSFFYFNSWDTIFLYHFSFYLYTFPNNIYRVSIVFMIKFNWSKPIWLMHKAKFPEEY